jgi:hypothetical protein
MRGQASEQDPGVQCVAQGFEAPCLLVELVHLCIFVYVAIWLLGHLEGVEATERASM